MLRPSFASRLLPLAAIAGLLAGGPAHQAALRPEPPRLAAPSTEYRSHRKEKRWAWKRKTRLRQMEAARRNAERQRRPRGDVQTIVARMTNWQRNQWARAGYPKKLADAKRFAAMERVAV
jgi:hypothetical protein